MIFTEELKYIQTLKNDESIALIDVIKFFFKNKIIHRDIRPSNIMIGNDKIIRIIDFGFAYKFEQNENKKMLMIQGATTFAAIEFLREYLLLTREKLKNMVYNYAHNFDLYCALNVIVYKINKEARSKMKSIIRHGKSDEGKASDSLKLWENVEHENKTYFQLIGKIRNVNNLSDFEEIKKILKKNFVNLKELSNSNFII